jgi:hypothetical protein
VKILHLDDGKHGVPKLTEEQPLDPDEMGVAWEDG